MTPTIASGGSLLRIDALTKSFGGFVALDNIDVEIRKGERFGLIGPNGSGKTTLVNCISGVLRPNKGAVLFGDEDITPLAPNQRAHRGIARSFQIPRPFKSMTVLENLTMATGPKLLISDEAMAGLSASEVDEVMDLLMSLGGEDVAVIMIEHIMQAVMRFSDRVMCLDAGRIIAIGTPAEVMANARVQEAYLGT